MKSLLQLLPILICSSVYAEECKNVNELQKVANKHHDSWVELKGDQFHLSQALYGFVNDWAIPKGNYSVFSEHKDKINTATILFVDDKSCTTQMSIPTSKIESFKNLLDLIKEDQGYVGWPL